MTNFLDGLADHATQLTYLVKQYCKGDDIVFNAIIAKANLIIEWLRTKRWQKMIKGPVGETIIMLKKIASIKSEDDRKEILEMTQKTLILMSQIKIDL